MLADADLEALLTDLESDRSERKASISERDKIRQAICAFANDLPNHGKPGVIFIGANDDGSCAKFPITDDLLRTLADMRSDGNILPPPTMFVQKRTLLGCELAVIEVLPADSPPVRYKGRVWIRVGPRRAQATAEEERRLTEKRRWGNLPFDQQPIPGLDFDALSLELFQREYLPSAVSRDVLEQNERAVTNQLAAQRFLARDGKPNVAAALFFSPDPRAWLPGAYIQFARFDGTAITDSVKDRKEVSGPLGQMLQRMEDLFAANISVATDYRSSAKEITHPDYPVIALQQLIRNAVMHRTYDGSNAPVRCYWFTDRIEILSPGGLYGQVTPDNFGKHGATDYRNPLIAEGLKVLGFVQRFGIGIPLVHKELKQNGNPPPEFEFQPTNVHALVRRAE